MRKFPLLFYYNHINCGKFWIFYRRNVWYKLFNFFFKRKPNWSLYLKFYCSLYSALIDHVINNTLRRNTMDQIVIFNERFCYELHSLFTTPRRNAMWTKLECETLSKPTIQVRRRISCLYILNNLPIADSHSRS